MVKLDLSPDKKLRDGRRPDPGPSVTQLLIQAMPSPMRLTGILGTAMAATRPVRRDREREISTFQSRTRIRKLHQDRTDQLGGF